MTMYGPFVASCFLLSICIYRDVSHVVSGSPLEKGNGEQKERCCNYLVNVMHYNMPGNLLFLLIAIGQTFGENACIGAGSLAFCQLRAYTKGASSYHLLVIYSLLSEQDPHWKCGYLIVGEP